MQERWNGIQATTKKIICSKVNISYVSSSTIFCPYQSTNACSETKSYISQFTHTHLLTYTCHILSFHSPQTKLLLNQWSKLLTMATLSLSQRAWHICTTTRYRLSLSLVFSFSHQKPLFAFFSVFALTITLFKYSRTEHICICLFVKLSSLSLTLALSHSSSFLLSSS